MAEMLNRWLCLQDQQRLDLRLHRICGKRDTQAAVDHSGATCTTTGGVTAAQPTSLTIGGQTIIIAGGGFGGFPGGGRGPHR